MKKPSINDQQRRSHILDAFIVHVIDKGFHRASMAEIAKTAGLSVGQIYRYFSNKEEMICVLVEQQTESYLTTMEDFLEKKDWLARHFEHAETEEFKRNRLLHLEILAEASRSPSIAAIQEQAEARLNKHALKLIEQRYDLNNQADIAARLEFLIALTKGLLVRSDSLERPFSIQAHALYQRIFDELFPD
ncbi:TetR/AcrR family transcriptional regulator [Rhodanobacter aciditrophus]|uniref:TetR/AcrR family transcriptional regulator n=1 Tax=Rhodanobacter aciditrophus TaxID=1623218 RepID=A0ABW4AXH7_9GAMM